MRKNKIGGWVLLFVFALGVNLVISADKKILLDGYKEVRFGMTVEEVKAKAGIVKSEGENLSYTEHFEFEPEVYIEKRKKEDDDKIEYYFVNHKLYKIFVIRPQKLTSRELYEQSVADLVKDYYKPDKTYQDMYFGFEIDHNVWDDGKTRIDLRMGAGYIYQVILSKELNREKHEKMKDHGKEKEDIAI